MSEIATRVLSPPPERQAVRGVVSPGGNAVPSVQRSASPQASPVIIPFTRTMAKFTRSTPPPAPQPPRTQVVEDEGLGRDSAPQGADDYLNKKGWSLVGSPEAFSSGGPANRPSPNLFRRPLVPPPPFCLPHVRCCDRVWALGAIRVGSDWAGPGWTRLDWARTRLDWARTRLD